MHHSITRRRFMLSAAAAGSATAIANGRQDVYADTENDAPAYQDGASPWPLALNTSTIQPASLDEKIEATIAAGYDGIEPWDRELEAYEEEGGDLADIRARFEEAGLIVPNVIGIWNAMPPAREAFEDALPSMREQMRRAAAVGAERIAVVPTPDRADIDLQYCAELYRELLDIGREDYGLIPAFEFLGPLEGVHRFSQACAVAIDADDPDACIINDLYHMYRGGSGIEGLGHVQGSLIGVFHWNDVPAEPPREELSDPDRVLPGDGILPIPDILRTLERIGFRGALSLELFNRDLWEQPPEEAAKLGIEKMREGVRDVHNG